jgi:hypothetical protein
LDSQGQLVSFIRESVRSVWALELLLLLRRTPDRLWTEEALVRELRASLPLVRDNLAVFETSGLVACEAGGCRYAPASPVLAGLCDELERRYRESPVRLINAIASPKDKLQTLADAFKLKGDGK